MKIVFLLLIPFLVLYSCESTQKPIVSPDPVIDLVGKVYFIGPFIDSVKVEIDAGCDCCASDIAFLEDSSFIYAAYCLYENTYLKGDFEVRGEQLFLHFDAKIVDYITEPEFDDETGDEIPTDPVLKISTQKPHTERFVISELKGRKVLTFPHKDGAEYGLESDAVLEDLLEDLRSLGVSEKLFGSNS